ncbi:ABC transporter permease [Planomonospora sp. ID67723]|uniref:ABC transporter permease n=1 Tax=Planomonospora sp. ID67723 TaxID=2738134 RepID=UPI0018C3C688|nr:ABC transporter permease [Planomonospora sp. ID67723]MBG0832971.1 ABC transporter permease [Planomonospora sp. ID67723]
MPTSATAPEPARRQTDTGRITSARQFTRFALAVSVLGIMLQLALNAYYLSVGHAPSPHDLPVGVVGAPAQRQALTAQLEKDGAFAVTVYDSPQRLTGAIRGKDVYGGVDLTAERPTLYLASAAGPSAANLLRTTFITAIAEQTGKQVRTLVDQGRPVPAATVAALTAPPAVTDVVPLPAADRNGAALGFLVQALVLGGTIASTGLGRLIPLTPRSHQRGLGHVATLVVYALGSAAVVLWTMSWFDVGTGADAGRLLAEFTLISLAITASTAGAVALIGPAGALLGLGYFTVGTVISGAGVLPEFLPDPARAIGQALPPGAGVSAVRDSMYFPTADISGPLLTLGLYAGLGCLIVLVTNTLPNRSRRHSEVDLHLVERLEGHPVPAVTVAAAVGGPGDGRTAQ